jgi:hypothetical protein
MLQPFPTGETYPIEAQISQKKYELVIIITPCVVVNTVTAV